MNFSFSPTACLMILITQYTIVAIAGTLIKFRYPSIFPSVVSIFCVKYFRKRYFFRKTIQIPALYYISLLPALFLYPLVSPFLPPPIAPYVSRETLLKFHKPFPPRRLVYLSFCRSFAAVPIRTPPIYSLTIKNLYLKGFPPMK